MQTAPMPQEPTDTVKLLGSLVFSGYTVLVIEQQLSLRVPSVGSPRLLLRRRQMEGLLLQLRLLRKWHRAPKQRIHNTRTSVSHVMCARACRASTVLTLLLLLGIVGLAGLIETLFFVTVRK
jgi:hypothetical protein